MSSLNMGNWYQPLTVDMALVLLALSILIEYPIILYSFRGEEKAVKSVIVVLVIISANVISFSFGLLFLALIGVL